MRPVFIGLTRLNTGETFLVNLNLVATCNRSGPCASKITLATGDELFVQESLEEFEELLMEALLNE